MASQLSKNECCHSTNIKSLKSEDRIKHTIELLTYDSTSVLVYVLLWYLAKCSNHELYKNNLTDANLISKLCSPGQDDKKQVKT